MISDIANHFLASFCLRLRLPTAGMESAGTGRGETETAGLRGWSCSQCPSRQAQKEIARLRDPGPCIAPTSRRSGTGSIPRRRCRELIGPLVRGVVSRCVRTGTVKKRSSQPFQERDPSSQATHPQKIPPGDTGFGSAPHVHWGCIVGLRRSWHRVRRRTIGCRQSRAPSSSWPARLHAPDKLDEPSPLHDSVPSPSP
jgi:hypothetical protein